jgi:hypothetical protein
MLLCLKNFWRAISSGWVVEYPSSNNGPQDFFDKKDRIPQGVQKRTYEDDMRGGMSSCGDRIVATE